MISLTTDMIFASAVYSLVSGAVFGLLYALGVWIIRKATSVLHGRASDSDGRGSKDGVLKHIFDFLIVFLMGVSQLLSNYVLLDGAFRIYTALITVVAFLLFKCAFLGAFRQIKKKRPSENV